MFQTRQAAPRGTSSLARAFGHVLLWLGLFGLGALAASQALEINQLRRGQKELSRALREEREESEQLSRDFSRAQTRAERLERRWKRSRNPMSAEHRLTLRSVTQLLDRICRAMRPEGPAAPPLDPVAYARFSELLGILHLHLAEPVRAEQFWNQALLANLEMRGEEHPVTRRILGRLFEHYRDEGQIQEALETMRDLVERTGNTGPLLRQE